MNISKIDEDFEIKNGIAGANRDVIFQLIGLMYFKSDELVQNLIGMCEKCVNWLNHPHFPHCRSSKPNLKKQIIKNPSLEEKKDVEINLTSIVFKLFRTNKKRSLFLSVLVKKMIFECTIRVEFHQDNISPCIRLGVSTPFHLNKAMGGSIGDSSDSGAGFYLSSYSQILCNGNWSCDLKEEKIKDGEIITAVIDQMNKENKSNYGKMNLIRFGKKLPHTIINIPLIEGVHFGFSGEMSSVILHIISLHKLRVPSISVCNNDGIMKCVSYNYGGKFKNCSYDHQDEDGEEISNIKEYYK